MSAILDHRQPSLLPKCSFSYICIYIYIQLGPNVMLELFRKKKNINMGNILKLSELILILHICLLF